MKELCVFSLNGMVNLKGTVQCRADRRAVQEAAEQAKGVIGVINQLNLASRKVARRRAAVESQVVASSSVLPFLSQTAASGSHVAN